MDNSLITQITPDNCYKYHSQMWERGIDLDIFCRCGEQPCKENLSIHPKRSEDEMTQKFLSSLKEFDI